MRSVSLALSGLFLATVSAAPALAEPLNAESAQRFVIGRTFSYTCYEGTVGSGRILKDGSVAGTIQMRGKGNARYVTLPAGTLVVKGEAVCAKLKGMAFQPCFDLEKTSEQSFRGNLAGADRLWCQFQRGGSGRTKLAAQTHRQNASTERVATAQADDPH
ncbi:hypothetical protein [Ancylobacter sp. G4_0304]|uniref:hypothetical protein n=1 Tax=Ancylobacter sp. G4_0304 TaxID=3114289 RepID=UPI0039C6C3D8